MPLWVRIDNLKTAVAPGAGSSAVLTPAFAAFAEQCGFAVDPCRARTGSDKGKVERTVRTDRSAFADLFLAAEAVAGNSSSQRALLLFDRLRSEKGC